MPVLITLMMLMALFAFSNAGAEPCTVWYTAEETGGLTYSLSLESRVDVPPKDPFSSPSRLSGGKFLVASRNIKDPRFSEAVILLVKYGLDGSMGLIINRPTDVRLSDAFPEIKELGNRTDSLYFGGPVSVGQIEVLFQSRSRHKESFNVFKDIFISVSQRVLRGLIVYPGKEERFRVYTGYAGWAPGQLDNEVLRGDWYILKADPETVFVKEPSGIWNELIRRITIRWWVDNQDYHCKEIKKRNMPTS